MCTLYIGQKIRVFVKQFGNIPLIAFAFSRKKIPEDSAAAQSVP